VGSKISEVKIEVFVFKGKLVMIVDDEPDLREILKDEFSMMGADTVEAANGREAAEVLAQKNIDFIVSDIRMPGGDGVSLLKVAKAKNPIKPAMVLITGFADINPSEAYSIGAEGFVTKPFDLESLRKLAEGHMLLGSKRWAKDLVAKKEITIQLNGATEIANHAEIKWGRGGAFITVHQGSYHLGDQVKVVLSSASSNAMAFSGVVRWSRSEAQPHLPKGIGLEFQAMTSELLLELEKIESFKTGAAFIPLA
jgi:CheY-like chemotaxis protein